MGRRSTPCRADHRSCARLGDAASYRWAKAATDDAPLASRSRLADTPTVEVLVALRYPNGRIYETVYDTVRPIEGGTEFELYGHTWRVVGLLEKHRVYVPPARPPRILCVAVEDSSRLSG